MFFKDIKNQNRIIKILRSIAQKDKIANAYLFSGPIGSGQQEIALAFSRLINCLNPIDGDACGSCQICQKYEKKVLPDFAEIKPAGSSIKKEQIKDLAANTKYGPSESHYFVNIIEDADTMTAEAANSFLKLLEEPPPRTIFILLTFNKNSLISTIVSRCQHFSLNYVEANIKLPNEELDLQNMQITKLFQKANDLSKDKKTAEIFIDNLLTFFKNKKEFSQVQVVLKCLQKFQYNVNLKLCLESMFLELFYG